jgi:hypothetical protein
MTFILRCRYVYVIISSSTMTVVVICNCDSYWPVMHSVLGSMPNGWILSCSRWTILPDMCEYNCQNMYDHHAYLRRLWMSLPKLQFFKSCLPAAKDVLFTLEKIIRIDRRDEHIRYDDQSDVCLPSQCWSRERWYHSEHRYPCPGTAVERIDSVGSDRQEHRSVPMMMIVIVMMLLMMMIMIVMMLMRRRIDSVHIVHTKLDGFSSL